MLPKSLPMPLLGDAADRLIVKAISSGCPRYAWKAAKSRPANEAAAVRAVMLCGVSRIGAAWRRWLRPAGYFVSTSAIFCHQTPKVHSVDGTVTSCELADLLVVVDFGAGGILGRRAALIQAKVVQPNGDVKFKSPGDLNQLELYLNWPEFCFDKTGIYGSASFLIKVPSAPALAGEGCRYGGIDRDVGSERWVDLAAAQKMNIAGGLALGDYVARMAFGLAGRAARPGGPDQWSKLIDLLLAVAKNETYGRANPIPRSRWSQTQAHAFLSASGGEARVYQYMGDGFRRTVYYEKPPNDSNSDESERPDGAISTLHITIGADEMDWDTGR